MSGAEIQAAVAQGGRFLVFPYCVSVLVLTFKRSSPIFFVKAGESAFSKGMPYALISLLAGWWGIPWGPIWTLTTLATNLSGGKDVTREVLAGTGLPMPVPVTASSPSPVEVAAREEHKSLVMKLAWAAVALLFLGGGFVAYKIYDAGQKLSRQPGELEFRRANGKIRSGGPVASGNSQKASEIAAEMNKAMRAFRDSSMQATRETSFLDEHDQFRTYCNLNESQSVFLIHVPELRRFDAESRKAIAQSAWVTAQSLLEKHGESRPGMRLAVGVRGIAAYDRILTGSFTVGAESNSSIPEIREGLGCERELASWFEPK